MEKWEGVDMITSHRIHEILKNEIFLERMLAEHFFLGFCFKSLLEFLP